MKKNKAIHFFKMHGAGNDFVFLTPEMAGRPITSALAKRLLDRHFGIGADQLLVLKTLSGPPSYQLDFFNADGSMAEMCGNGTRAVAHFLREFKNVKRNFAIKTRRGLVGIRYGSRGDIEVDMGKPILDGPKIPVKAQGEIVNHRLKVGKEAYLIHAVSMGNPHCVIFVHDVKRFAVTTVGPLIERHSFFPNRVNVEFVQRISSTHVKARVWERGAGETLACGTGACAIVVAGVRGKKTSPSLIIDLPGGRLKARWDQRENGHVFLSGPAEVTYEGRFYV